MSASKRLRYYDLLRIISFLMVIFYHMMVQLQINGICTAEQVSPWFANANMHIATLAVAIFFMLSGAGLTIRADKSFSLKEYYKSRFLRLLIPFYVAVVLFYVFSLIVDHMMPANFRSGVPAWRFIYTLLGIDEWVAMHGIATFSTSIGEWFLGVLIILSVLFPLFYSCMKRWPKFFLAVCSSIYVAVIYNYRSSVVMHMSFPIKAFEFILGMYFARYYQKFPDKWVILAVPASVFFFVSTTVLNLNYALKISLSAVALFIAFSGLESVLQNKYFSLLEKVSSFSYPVFLVHHIIIYRATPLFAPYYSGRFSVLVFFLIEIAVMIICSILLKLLSDWLIHLLNRPQKAS